MVIIGLVLITIISIIVSIYCIRNKIQIDTETKKMNEEIQTSYQNNKKIYNELSENLKYLKIEENQLKNKVDNLLDIWDSYSHNLKETSESAFEEWFEVLEKSYAEKEDEYNKLCQELKDLYNIEKEKTNEEILKCQKELDKIKATKKAVMAAARKEKEIKEQLSFYCLRVTKEEKEDIQRLERVKIDLHNPRVLSMLIWSTYFQKQMTLLCNNVLGLSTVTGIYKITNQTNDMCYIGQSVDVAQRWKSHAKCGLGIDTPASNKLYKAMQEDGIWNFSWELLERCPSAELNEKERYYINLYQSYDYGYNSNTGIKK